MAALNLGYCCQNLQIPGGYRAVTETRMRSLTKEDQIKLLLELCVHNMEHLRTVTLWNTAFKIWCYRIPSDLLPLWDHQDYRGGYLELQEDIVFNRTLRRLRKAVKIWASEAGSTGCWAWLGTHPGQYTVVSSRDKRVNLAGVYTLERHMRLLELLDPGLENTDIQYNINIHVSNGSKNPVETADIVRGNLQTLNTVKGLPAYQGLLSFENEDRGCWTPETLLETFPDVPVVLDLHHHRCNPDPDTKDGIPQERTLQRIYDSWFSARGCAPLWHHSSAKTSPPETCRSHGNRMTVGDMETVYQLRRWFGAIELEVKDKDIALFEARKLLTKIDKKYAQT